MSHRPISLSDFKGLYARGENENVPPGYLIECLNLDWDGDIIKTRGGSELEFSIDDIIRVYEYRRIGEASVFLVLTTGGFLYDSTDLSTAILSITEMVDFSAHTMFNRCYITPHNRVEGLPGEKVYIYDGSTLRAAAGAAPTGTMGIAVSATPGNVEVGTHLYAVVFETESGYLTVPGPSIFAILEAAGGISVDLSTIPVGPSGTVARRIIATRAIPSYNGNQNGYSYYFVPFGRIADNTTTTLTVSFFDGELFLLADYLFNQLEELPACLGITSYNGQLVLWNEDGNNSLVRVSKRGEPESVNSLDGFIVVDPAESTGVTNCFAFRDSLYMCKQARTYQTSDNGYAPGTWTWVGIDGGGGTTVFGVGTILDSRGNHVEGLMIADESGLMLFNGLYIKPELTYNIEDVWKRINKDYFDQVQVVVNPRKKVVYVSVPLDSATAPSHVLVGDFNRGLASSAIRWSIWTFPTDPRSILINKDATTGEFTLSYARVNNFYSINEANTNDVAIAIPQPILHTHQVSFGDSSINHFGLIHLRIKGVGNLQIFPYGLDGVQGTQLKLIVLSSTSGIEVPVPNAFVNERMSLRMYVPSIDNWMRIIKIQSTAKQLYISGPA